MLKVFKALFALLLLISSFDVIAHGVDDNTQKFLAELDGPAIIPLFYIGAKHMVTGYDHLLFLFGVIFFLFKPKDILIYVTFFTIGHSVTLIFGVLSKIQLNAYLIDAIIGLSIVYKAFDNLGGFKTLFAVQPNTKVAVLVFGLFHGFGLATKLQEFSLPENGLLSNLLAFNVGVEFGQFFALAFILIVISYWRRFSSFQRWSNFSNILLMSFGFMLVGFQLTGYFIN